MKSITWLLVAANTIDKSISKFVNKRPKYKGEL